MKTNNPIPASSRLAVWILAAFTAASLHGATDSQVTAASLWQQSIALEQNADYDGAIAKVIEFSKKSNDVYLVLVRCGWLNARAKQYDLAAKHYAAAVKVAPTAITPLVGLASAYRAAGENVKAESTCQQILARDPGNYTALQIVAAIAFEKLDYRKAAQYFDAMTKLYPEDTAALSGAGWSFLYTNRKTDSAAAFRRLLLIAPDFTYARQGYEASIAGKIVSNKL